MSLLVFLAICAAGCFVSALAAGFRRAGETVGLAALAAALVAALLVEPGDGVTAGGVELMPTWFGGLFVSACLAASLFAAAIGLMTETPRGFAAAALGTVALLGLALSATQPAVALFAAVAAASPAVALAARRDDPPLGAFELRILAVLGAGTLLAAACALAARWTGDVALAAPAAAYLLLAGGLALRSGTVPFHVPAARLARAGTPLVLALLLVWIPAGAGAVALGWTEGISARDGSVLPTALVLAFAVGTLVLGAAAALLHSDVAEVAAYSIVQDSGFLLLALAARPGTSGDPARLWLLCFVLAKTALIVWIAALAAGFGTRQLNELSGWARRMPLLAAALAVSAVAAIGWPGLAVFEARSDLVDGAVTGPFTAIAWLAAAMSALVYGRLLVRGLLPAGPVASAAPGEKPKRPVRAGRRTQARPVAAAVSDPRGWQSVAVAAAAAAATLGTAAGDARTLARANVVPARSAAVLAVALIAAVVAAGGFGATGAASSDWSLAVSATAGPTVAADLEPAPGGSPSSPATPPAERSGPAPGTSETPASSPQGSEGSVRPSATLAPSATSGPSPSPGPSKSPGPSASPESSRSTAP